MLPDENILAQFAGAKGRRAQYHLNQLETFLTPQEYLELGEMALPPYSAAARLLANNIVLKDIQSHPSPQPFIRKALAQGALLFSAPRRAGPVDLLVCFTGRVGRMTLAAPTFLQHIDAARFDVLILTDRDGNHYRSGLSPDVPTFAALRDLVQAQVRTERYRNVISMGVSMGGLPAIRLGLNSWCDFAVSVAGQPPKDVGRILQGISPGWQAFDALCACMPTRPRKFCFVHAELKRNDRRWAMDYARRTGGCRVVARGLRDHCVLPRYWQRGELKSFLDFILTPGWLHGLDTETGKVVQWSVARDGQHMLRKDSGLNRSVSRLKRMLCLT